MLCWISDDINICAEPCYVVYSVHIKRSTAVYKCKREYLISVMIFIFCNDIHTDNVINRISSIYQVSLLPVLGFCVFSFLLLYFLFYKKQYTVITNIECHHTALYTKLLYPVERFFF